MCAVFGDLGILVQTSVIPLSYILFCVCPVVRCTVVCCVCPVVMCAVLWRCVACCVCPVALHTVV